MAKKKSLTDEEKKTNKINWAKSLLDQARAVNFYGKIVIHVENGVPQRADNIRSLHPPEDT